MPAGWNTPNMGWPCQAAVLNLGHAPGFAAGRRHGAGYPDIAPPGLLELFVAFARMSLAGFGGVLVLRGAASSISTDG